MFKLEYRKEGKKVANRKPIEKQLEDIFFDRFEKIELETNKYRKKKYIPTGKKIK